MTFKTTLIVASTLGSLILSSGPSLALPAAVFEGRPKFDPGSLTGAAIWSDDSGIHLRLTAKRARTPRRWRGSICAAPGNTIAHFQGFKLEKQDSIKLDSKRRCLWFDLRTKDGIDGVDLRVPGDHVAFTLLRGRRSRLATERILIGKDAAHPASNPFYLRRTDTVPDVDASAFEGKPTLSPGARNRASVWQDGDTHHVRFTTNVAAKADRRWRGQVCSAKQKITSVRPVKLEKDDSARVAAGGYCVFFDVRTASGIDGFSFESRADRLVYDVRLDGLPLRNQQIALGKASTHAPASPFAFKQQP